MNTIYNYVEGIQNASQELLNNTRLVKKYHDECDFESFVSTARKGARITSNLCLMYRELLLSLNEYIPSLPGLERILNIECEAMGIFVERVAEYNFPMYKISLPMLLPNMRRRKEDFNNEVTMTVNAAVKRFCIEHNIHPFEYATICGDIHR